MHMHACLLMIVKTWINWLMKTDAWKSNRYQVELNLVESNGLLSKYFFNDNKIKSNKNLFKSTWLILKTSGKYSKNKNEMEHSSDVIVYWKRESWFCSKDKFLSSNQLRDFVIWTKNQFLNNISNMTFCWISISIKNFIQNSVYSETSILTWTYILILRWTTYILIPRWTTYILILRWTFSSSKITWFSHKQKNIKNLRALISFLFCFQIRLLINIHVNFHIRELLNTKLSI